MRRRSSRWSLGLATVVLATTASAFAQAGGAGGAPPVEDAGPPRVAYVVDPEIDIPRNGAVLIQLDYAHGDDELVNGAPIVQVRAEGTDTNLGGTLRAVDGFNFWAWVPTSQPEPGRYIVSVASESGWTDDTITVTEAIDLAHAPRPDRVVAALADVFPFETSTAYCVALQDGHIVQSGPSFPVTASNQIDLLAELSAPAELLHQFFYTSAMEGEPFYQPHQVPDIWPRTGRYTMQSERYCAVFKTISIANGDEQETKLCAPHGSLPTLGIQDVAVTDEQLERHVCLGPPAGLEERWCALNRACEQADGSDGSCALYGYVCRNECLPDGRAIGSLGLPMGGNGETPSVGGERGIGIGDGGCIDRFPDPRADGSALPSTMDAAGPSGDPMVRAGSDGCGCAVVGGRSHARGAWLLPLLGWALFARRPRRRA